MSLSLYMMDIFAHQIGWIIAKHFRPICRLLYPLSAPPPHPSPIRRICGCLQARPRLLTAAQAAMGCAEPPPPSGCVVQCPIPVLPDRYFAQI
jgi:hypothetical protein